MSITDIKLSKIEKYKKFQLASIAGYKVEEDKDKHKCHIVGADNFIENDFKNIDEVLKLIKRELLSKGFNIVAA